MPVILPPAAHDAWLGDERDPERLRALLPPYADADMAFTRVSTRVNSVKNDDPACMEPEPTLV
jgi:putative SOS response-associated peptidase YedK